MLPISFGRQLASIISPLLKPIKYKKEKSREKMRKASEMFSMNFYRLNFISIRLFSPIHVCIWMCVCVCVIDFHL